MKGLLTLIFFTITSVSIAQDYHHWSEHFGARASLLGGAATAGLGDNATVYYNPAAMAFVENPSLSISVNAYRYRMLNIQNAFGDLSTLFDDGGEIKESHFSSIPNLIAGVLAPKKFPKLRLGYSVLTRRTFNQKYDMLNERYVELIPDPFWGQELWVYSYNHQHQLMEYWAGFGISYQVSKAFSIGLSHFGAYRDVKYNNSWSSSILPQLVGNYEVYDISSTQSYNYYNVKGVFKPSVALSLDKFKMGVTFTTPSFSMFGKAKAYREIAYINMADLDSLAYPFDLYIVDREEGIKAQHKEFGSVAIGLSTVLWKGAWLHLSSEIFFGGKEYYIFDADEKPSIYPNLYTEEDLEAEVFGQQNYLSLTEETRAVTNFGLGLEVQLAERLGAYLGARTDFRYNELPTEDKRDQVMFIQSSRWNLMHYSGAFVYTTKKNKRYTVGMEYSHLLKGYGYEGQGDATSHSFKLLFEIEIGKLKKGNESTN